MTARSRFAAEFPAQEGRERYEAAFIDLERRLKVDAERMLEVQINLYDNAEAARAFADENRLPGQYADPDLRVLDEWRQEREALARDALAELEAADRGERIGPSHLAAIAARVRASLAGRGTPTPADLRAGVADAMTVATPPIWRQRIGALAWPIDRPKHIEPRDAAITGLAWAAERIIRAAIDPDADLGLAPFNPPAAGKPHWPIVDALVAAAFGVAGIDGARSRTTKAAATSARFVGWSGELIDVDLDGVLDA